MSDPNTFTIAVRKFGPFESAMQKFWTAFCAQSGCTLKLKLEIMDLHELYQRTLSENGLKDGTFDVAHINTDWILEGHVQQAFEVLNPYIEKHPPADYPQGWSNSLLKLQEFEGAVVGLPFHDGPECLMYRKDLFDDKSEQKAYAEQYGQPLGVPQTWEEFHQIAKFFHRPDANLYGSIFAGFPDGHNAVFDFCLQLWTRGGDLLDQHGDINIDTPAALAALTFYRIIFNDPEAVHPKSAEFDSVAAGIAFSQGEAALMVNWFGFAAMCQIDANSKVKDQVGVALLPSAEDQKSASLNVYWLYTIGSGSQYKDIAYQFLQFVTTAINDKLLTLEGGIGCRLSTWKDREINQLIPFYHKLEMLHQVAKMLPQRKNWASIVAIIDEMMQKVMHMQHNLNDILTNAQEKINSIRL